MKNICLATSGALAVEAIQMYGNKNEPLLNAEVVSVEQNQDSTTTNKCTQTEQQEKLHASTGHIFCHYFFYIFVSVDYQNEPTKLGSHFVQKNWKTLAICAVTGTIIGVVH